MHSPVNFTTITTIMRRLRAPGGCPWDAEQTHASLKRYAIEECYEVVEAIDMQDDQLLCEELGDLLLQPVFHAAIAEDRGAFSIDDVLTTLADKLIRRHPHVFGEADQITSSDQQVANWEAIKKQEKKHERHSVLDGVPPHLPALMRAQKTAEKAARVGFDWSTIKEVFAKVEEEVTEVQEAIESGNTDRVEAEIGDALFALVNLARFTGHDAESALRRTIDTFTRRFQHIEQSIASRGGRISEAPLSEMEHFWCEAKRLDSLTPKV